MNWFVLFELFGRLYYLRRRRRSRVHCDNRTAVGAIGNIMTVLHNWVRCSLREYSMLNEIVIFHVVHRGAVGIGQTCGANCHIVRLFEWHLLWRLLGQRLESHHAWRRLDAGCSISRFGRLWQRLVLPWQRDILVNRFDGTVQVLSGTSLRH